MYHKIIVESDIKFIGNYQLKL